MGLFQPAISKKSVKMLEKKGIESTMDLLRSGRSLSNGRSKRVAMHLSEQEQVEAQYYRPQISQKAKQIKRGIQPLIDDAQRRQQAKSQLQQLMTEKANLDANRAFINTKSDKVLYDRVLSDFNGACQSIEVDPANDEATANCVEMSHLFKSLGFVSFDSDKEHLLLASVWKMLGGNPDGEGQVLLHNVKVVMCAILNFHIDWMIDYDRTEMNTQHIGHFENGILYLNPNEISHMTKKYVLMYQNRQQSLSTNKKAQRQRASIQKGNYGEIFKYKPQVSPVNRTLAREANLRNHPNTDHIAVHDRLL